MSWWSSIEKVSKVNTGLQIIASIPAFLAGAFALMGIISGTVILTFAAGVIALLSAIVSRRAAKLQTEQYNRQLELNKARRLTREQHNSLVKALMSIPHEGEKVVIQSVGHDPEAHDFAVEIRHVFRAVEWWLFGVHLSPDTPDGLTIRAYSSESLPYLEKVQTAFESIGLSISVESFNHPHPRFSDSKMFICVGRRRH